MLEKKDTIEHEIKDNKCETIRLSNLSSLVNYTWFAGFVWLKEKKKKEKCIAIHHEKEKKETNLSIQDVLPFTGDRFYKATIFHFFGRLFSRDHESNPVADFNLVLKRSPIVPGGSD